MNQKGNVAIIIAVTIVVLALLAGLFYFLSQNQVQISVNPDSSPKATRQTDPTFPTPVTNNEENSNTTPTPKTTAETDNTLTYKNSEYGFEFEYPKGYEALDDSDNLYGWKNGIVLLYGGGQAYDFAVQVWSSTEDFENNFGPNKEDVEIVEGNGKVFSLYNVSGNEKLQEVIDTFKTF